MSCPSGSPWYYRCRGGSRGKRLGMHSQTPASLFREPCGGKRKLLQVLEVLIGKLEQILAEFPVLGKVQITGHEKGWAEFSKYSVI